MAQENGYEISVITVNYNGYEDTCALIDTLPLEDKTVEIIVVDNGSTRDEAAIISDRYPMVKAFRLNTNTGFAGGNNYGIRKSSGKYLFFVNNDTIFKEWNARNLIKRLESDKKIGMVCPKIRFAYDSCNIQYAGYTPLSNITVRNRSIGFNEQDNGQYDTACPTPYAHGAAMMTRRETIDKAGLMPECYFLYYEELDWSMRIHDAGYDIWYEPECTIYHKESRSTGQGSPLKTRFLTRNRLLFARRNISRPTRYSAYTYLIAVVATRDILSNLIKGRPELAKATVDGIISFLKS